MSQNVWSKLHQDYKKKNWIDKPSIFAKTAVRYFPPSGKILDLGAGQGQDSRFFAECGYDVVSTDISDEAISLSREKLKKPLQKKMIVEKLDLTDDFSYPDESFDVVYAHLSLHYFHEEITKKIFNEIGRILKKGGVFSFLVNSVDDPECAGGEKIEDDFYKVGKIFKRYFSIKSARNFTKYFEISLLDNFGEAYKDCAKGVHHLIRFIGIKPREKKIFSMAIPFVGGIIEREHNNEREILMQTRWKPNSDRLYSGTLEFPAGVLDHPYEEIYQTLKKEIKEECGLTLKAITNDSRTKKYRPKGCDESFGFRPFCCVQQLKDGKPMVGFIFRCEVEDGNAQAQISEVKDVKWMKASKLKEIFERKPQRLFTSEIPSWEYYFKEVTA